MKRYSSLYSMKALAPSVHRIDTELACSSSYRVIRIQPAAGAELSVMASIEALCSWSMTEASRAAAIGRAHVPRPEEVPCVEVSSVKRAEPAVARSEHAVGQSRISGKGRRSRSTPPRTTKRI